MSVVELEKAITLLTEQELQEFRAWFADFDMEQWDRRIENDSQAGRLDHVIREALEEYRAGRSKDL